MPEEPKLGFDQFFATGPSRVPEIRRQKRDDAIAFGELEIRSRQIVAMLAARSEVGDLICKSPSNMAGDWNLSQATETSLAEGWMHRGDAAYMDEDGYGEFVA